MLVPEISLTPQMLDRFIGRFGKEEIAILHSKLSIGERYDEWNKIKEKRAKIVIGARSAIFAPIENVGIIIIDEEHDSSEIEIRIREGKYHQIKRMFGAVGMKVVELERISMGKLKLPKDLKRGEYIELNLDDVSKIK